MYTTLFKGLVLSTLCTVLGASAALSATKASRVHGTLKGNVTFSPTNIAVGAYTVKVECKGALSHLGRSGVVWEGNLSLDGTLQPKPLAGLGWSLKSAQGSTLRGTIIWQAHSTNSPGNYTISGTLQTTDGTGRLQGATGQGRITGTINALTRKATLRVDGLLNTVRRQGRSQH